MEKKSENHDTKKYKIVHFEGFPTIFNEETIQSLFVLHFEYPLYDKEFLFSRLININSHMATIVYHSQFSVRCTST